MQGPCKASFALSEQHPAKRTELRSKDQPARARTNRFIRERVHGTVSLIRMKSFLKNSPPEFSFTISLVVVVILLCLYGCGNRESELGSRKSGLGTQLVPLTNMIFVKAGTFMRIKFPVTLTHDFWLGKYEVTQGEYASMMGKNPSHFPGDTNRPVEKVKHFEAVAYCSAVTKREQEAGRLPPGWTYRLPTEAEWEYACRAGTTNLFSFGNSATNADQYAWTQENSESITHPVGQKRPNPWGLYDIHGNVWEWCSDWFAPYPAAALTNPAGPTQGKFKVFRGGGWNNDADFARSANRFMMSPSNGIYFVGFRIALSPLQPVTKLSER
jgi:hypothetical protein